MSPERPHHKTELRVRYSETYNSRALEWFECGRTEALRALGVSYAEMERRGVYLPLVEAHVYYRGRARYDDALVVCTRVSQCGRASVRFDVEIRHRDGAKVVDGYTVHAVTDGTGRPIRCPEWLTKLLSENS